MITKSDFMNYLECPMYFWLSKNRPDLIPKDSSEKETILAMGREVDDFSRKLFPNGFEVQGFNKQGWENTKKAILEDKKILFQPTVMSKDISCRADILTKENNKWVLNEVKMSTKVKKEYIYDTGFQFLCFKKAGIEIDRIKIVYINKDYVRNGEIEPEKLFVSRDITNEVTAKLEEIEDEIQRATLIKDWKDFPDSRLINSCKNPKYCDYIDY